MLVSDLIEPVCRKLCEPRQTPQQTRFERLPTVDRDR